MKTRPLSLLPVACLLGLWACSEDDMGNNNNARLDAHIRLDAQVDAQPGVDASLTCDAPDLIDQFLCGAGRKCTLTNGTSTVGCADAGGTPGYSSCTPTFPDDCEVGTLCSDAAGSYQCLPFCDQPGTFCEGGRCGDVAVASSGGVSIYLCEPTDSCNPVPTDPALSECGAGEACYIAAVGDGLTFCETEGTSPVGEPCVDDFSCEQGYSCFGPSGDGVCRKVCRAGVNADCPGTQTCGPLNDTYGICFGY